MKRLIMQWLLGLVFAFSYSAGLQAMFDVQGYIQKELLNLSSVVSNSDHEKLQDRLEREDLGAFSKNSGFGAGITASTLAMLSNPGTKEEEEKSGDGKPTKSDDAAQPSEEQDSKAEKTSIFDQMPPATSQKLTNLKRATRSKRPPSNRGHGLTSKLEIKDSTDDSTQDTKVKSFNTISNLIEFDRLKNILNNNANKFKRDLVHSALGSKELVKWIEEWKIDPSDDDSREKAKQLINEEIQELEKSLNEEAKKELATQREKLALAEKAKKAAEEEKKKAAEEDKKHEEQKKEIISSYSSLNLDSQDYEQQKKSLEQKIIPLPPAYQLEIRNIISEIEKKALAEKIEKKKAAIAQQTLAFEKKIEVYTMIINLCTTALKEKGKIKSVAQKGTSQNIKNLNLQNPSTKGLDQKFSLEVLKLKKDLAQRFDDEKNKIVNIMNWEALIEEFESEKKALEADFEEHKKKAEEEEHKLEEIRKQQEALQIHVVEEIKEEEPKEESEKKEESKPIEREQEEQNLKKIEKQKKTAYNVSQADIETLTQWSNRCLMELLEHSKKDKEANKNVLEYNEFKNALSEFIALSKTEGQDTDLWLDGKTAGDDLFDISKKLELKKYGKVDLQKAYHPFVQKRVIPESSNVCFIGDLHGSVHSLLRNLWRLVALGWLGDDFKLTHQDLYIVFNGDFVDRGAYGVECIYTLLRLKLANWENVFLLRGNHENEKTSTDYGFKGEIDKKFKDNHQEAWNNLILRFYELLPFALYLGAGQDAENNTKPNFVQCCHGGVETGYDPKPLLDRAEDKLFARIPDEIAADYKKCSVRKDTDSDIVEKLTQRGVLSSSNIGMEEKRNNYDGFNWSDFEQDQGGTIYFNANRNMGYITDPAGANTYLKERGLKAFFRGHQDQSFGFKMFFTSSKDLEKAESDLAENEGVRLNRGVYDNGPYHWHYVVKDEDQKDFAVSKYEPIYTFSTAAEGQEVPYDCFGILSVANKYEDWKLVPHEHLLERDNESYLSLDLENEVKVIPDFSSANPGISAGLKTMATSNVTARTQTTAASLIRDQAKRMAELVAQDEMARIKKKEEKRTRIKTASDTLKTAIKQAFLATDFENAKTTFKDFLTNIKFQDSSMAVPTLEKIASEIENESQNAARFLKLMAQLLLQINSDDESPVFKFFDFASNNNCDELASKIVGDEDLFTDSHLDEDGRPPLLMAFDANLEKSVAALIQRLKVAEKFDNNLTDENTDNTLLHLAVDKSFVEIIKQLVDEGVNLEQKNNSGWTPLHLAVGSNQLTAVEKLLDLNANVNSVDNEGKTSLHHAAMSGFADIVELLVNKKATIEAKENDGLTPLLLAITEDKLEVVKKLLELGADFNAKTNDDQTAIVLAAGVENEVEIIELIKSYEEEGKKKLEEERKKEEEKKEAADSKNKQKTKKHRRKRILKDTLQNTEGQLSSLLKDTLQNTEGQSSSQMPLKKTQSLTNIPFNSSKEKSEMKPQIQRQASSLNLSSTSKQTKPEEKKPPQGKDELTQKQDEEYLKEKLRQYANKLKEERTKKEEAKRKEEAKKKAEEAKKKAEEEEKKKREEEERKKKEEEEKKRQEEEKRKKEEEERLKKEEEERKKKEEEEKKRQEEEKRKKEEEERKRLEEEKKKREEEERKKKADEEEKKKAEEEAKKAGEALKGGLEKLRTNLDGLKNKLGDLAKKLLELKTALGKK